MSMFCETGKTREDGGNTQMLAKRGKAPTYDTFLVASGDKGADGHDDSGTLLDHVTGFGRYTPWHLSNGRGVGRYGVLNVR